MTGGGAQPGSARTRWSMVAAVADPDPALARASLIELCQRHWYPVHAFLRRHGHGPEDAHALAAAFFRHLLSADRLDDAERRHARFRQFLRAELERFVSARQPASPAPSADLPVPPLAELEARLHADDALRRSPEEVLHRGFALQLLAAARDRLREEAHAAGRGRLYEALARFLGRDPDPGDHGAVARQLGVPPLHVAVAVRHLRLRFRELVDAGLGDTLADPAELEAERELLMRALADGAP